MGHVAYIEYVYRTTATNPEHNSRHVMLIPQDFTIAWIRDPDE